MWDPHPDVQRAPHTEECRRRHEANMSSEQDPRFEGAFDNLQQEDEEAMRRNHANRQANEET